MKQIRHIGRLPDTWPLSMRPMLGGKTSTTASTTTIPPQVLAQYQNVNNLAGATAQKPFQTYSGEFVAPLNGYQWQALDQTQNYAQAAQPYYQQAAGIQGQAQDIANGSLQYQQNGQGIINEGVGLQGYASDLAGQSVNLQNQGASTLGLAAGVTGYGIGSADPSNLDGAAINKYLSPYLGDVLNSTEALVNQQNQQQQAGQLGSAINSGAFGGDRTGIAAANLAQQEELAGGNLYANIANQGYNTALSTAQQQQGLSLSAQQANLARYLQGGSQLAGIGAQYGQLGNNTAQAAGILGGIGNNFTTAGNAVGQLGNNTLNTANTLGNIGNNVAGIGTAVQTGGLSGAASELAAGQVQQQTQQAQDTALYNQFLQQQGYPFQVDQFLANIAEGTGSLSGSTNTTTQPAPFFSDERLKEDVEPIGKTFEGQNIVKFRYKGSPHTQIGLLAQDVEKRHPEAVGLAGGYKTVDYDAATKHAAGLGAAKRYASGGYAEGGMPLGVGGGPADFYILQQILNNGRQIQGSAPGAQMMPEAGSTPYGGLKTLGAVLQAAGQGGPRHIASQNYTPPIKQPDSMLSQVNQVAGLDNNLKGLGSDAKGIYDFANKGLGSAANASQTLPDGSGLYASGGSVDPYGDEEGSYVPSENGDNNQKNLDNFRKLQGKPPGAPQSGLGELASAAGTASNLVGLGKTAMEAAPYAATMGSEIASALPFLLAPIGLADGGVARLKRASGGTDDFLPGDDATGSSLEPFLMPSMSKKETGPQSPIGHPALDTLNPPIPPTRPSDLGSVAPAPAQRAPAPSAPRAGLGGASINDNAGHMMADANRYEGQTLLNPAGITQNSGAQNSDAMLSGLGRSAAAAPNLMASKAEAVWNRMIPQESGGHQFDQFGRTLTSKTGAQGIAQVQPETGPEAAALAGLPWDPARLATDKDYNLALGHAYYNKQLATFGSPDLAAAAYNAGPAAVDKALAKAQANGDSYLNHLPGETQAYVANVAGGGGSAPASNAIRQQSGPGAPNGVQVAQNDNQGGLGGIGKSITDAGNGVGNYVQQNQNWLVPLLEGLGTMASSNSRYLGAAALQGLGGAAKGYEDVQNEQTRRALEQAHTGLTGAETGLTQAHTVGSLADTARANIVQTPNGAFILGPDGAYHLVGPQIGTGSVQTLGGPQAAAAANAFGHPQGGAPAAPAPPAPPPAPTIKQNPPSAPPPVTSASPSTESSAAPVSGKSMLGPAGLTRMEQDYQQLQQNPSQQELAGNEAFEKQINAEGAAGLKQGHTLDQLASELTKLPDNGALSGGALNEWKLAAASKVNDLMRTMGYPPDKMIYADDIATANAAKKLSGMLQFAATQSSGQTSEGALDAAKVIIPSTSLDKQSAAEVLAGLYVDKQQSIDRKNYLQDYKDALNHAHPGQGNLYRPPNINSAFSQDHNETQYGAEKENIVKFLTKPWRDTSMAHAIYSGKLSPAVVDKHVSPNFSRYFLNQ